MRYASEHKSVVRDRLLRNAARLLRQRGIAGTSVAKVMASAHMTVGGFYRHFRSQDALAGEAMAFALREARARLFQGLDDLRGHAFERGFVGRYVSTVHARDVAHGCPMPAALTEVVQLPRAERRPLRVEVESIIEYAAARNGAGVHGRARAITWLAACVGAVALARAMGGPLGEEILRSTRETLDRS